jgi:hypothetical protein
MLRAAAIGLVAFLELPDGPRRELVRGHDPPTVVSVRDPHEGRVYLSGPWNEFDLPGPKDPTFQVYETMESLGTVTARRGGPVAVQPRTGAPTWGVYEPAAEGFGAPVPPPDPRSSTPRARVSRNAPCPCGSGKKYKKCCLSSDLAGESVHQRDRRLVHELQTYAWDRFGLTWEDATDDFIDADAIPSLAMGWSVYVFPVRDRPMVDWFLESGGKIAESDRRWLEAQRESWLSMWEVLKVVVGQGLLLRDTFTDCHIEVVEQFGSDQLERGDQILARVTEFEGDAVISSIHPLRLSPLAGIPVFEAVRRYLRRKSAVPPDRMRQYKVSRYLLSHWETSAWIHSPDSGEATTLAFKRAHYAGWPDIPIPALGNRTPREAIATAEGRRQVAALIDEMERMERQVDTEEPYDFGELREKLGLATSQT